MTKTTGTRPTAAARAAGALRDGFRERVITPPDATDVAAALRAPLGTGLPIAVRGGGQGALCPHSPGV
jgi:hypothetical protein